MKLSLSVLCVVWRPLGRDSLRLSELTYLFEFHTPQMIFTFLLGWLGLPLLFLLPNSLFSSPLNLLKESFLRKLHNAECSLISSWWKTLTQRISDSVILLRLIWFLGMTNYFVQGRCYFNTDIILLCIKELNMNWYKKCDIYLISSWKVQPAAWWKSLCLFFSVVHWKCHLCKWRKTTTNWEQVTSACSAAWVDYFPKWRDRLNQVSEEGEWTKLSNTLSLQVKDGTQLLSLFWFRPSF